MVGGDQADLGSPGLVIPKGDTRAAAQAAISESYPEFVRSGIIDVVPGRVIALEDTEEGHVTARVQSAAGEVSIEGIGAVIYATGYAPASAVDFLPEDVKQELHYDSSSDRLPIILSGWQTMVESVPDLAILGFYEGPFWPIVEMQARLTADRWLSKRSVTRRPYEETEKLLDLRKAMHERAFDVPQYWFGDYAGFMEEMASHLQLHRNDGPFSKREGIVSPARYLSTDSDVTQAVAIMQDLHETWHACRDQGRYVPRATFLALQGDWDIHRTIKSALPSFPSGVLDGTASFHPRAPTKDKTGMTFDLEYLYIESGTLVLSNGASMTARRRYVYRYSEAKDTLSVWFVKPDNNLEVDYPFHDLEFVKPAEAAKEGACVAKADHLCVDDMYWTQYRFPFKGISLLKFENTHTVRGPNKDYVATTSFRRAVKHSG
ncbi:unnamed protein product [Zymoseptoria tritici ST99CH_1A5]|uniref:DUF6314 domain-containing protein n=1 Tax=Zymoseptoria tritici ST99CH_1A5 TaxID=1276529 RepID=A0A1Y6L4R2_ZYMTR|nr:unnamed protein product [Zymoseptoria tritici ST99CH_1A5]